MRVEDSKTEWKESEAPFIKVATRHSLPEHRPLGAVNRVRRTVYESVSKRRHDLNQSPRQEPKGDERF